MTSWATYTVIYAVSRSVGFRTRPDLIWIFMKSPAWFILQIYLHCQIYRPLGAKRKQIYSLNNSHCTMRWSAWKDFTMVKMHKVRLLFICSNLESPQVSRVLSLRCLGAETKIFIRINVGPYLIAELNYNHKIQAVWFHLHRKRHLGFEHIFLAIQITGNKLLWL